MGYVNKADLMAKQKHRECIWKDVPLGRMDGSAFHKHSPQKKRSSKITNLGMTMYKKCMFTSAANTELMRRLRTMEMSSNLKTACEFGSP